MPAFRLINTCNEGRYRIEKTVLADPDRSVILQEIKFVPLKGKRADYAVYALLNPHLGNQGKENTAWVGDYKGHPLLFAQRSDAALALACSVPAGTGVRSASSAPQTAGRTSRSTGRWPGPMSGPRRGTSP